jgi:hypothetical protein
VLPALFLFQPNAMRLHAILVISLAAISFASAQPAASGLRETALDNLLSERGPQKVFDTAIADARKHGVAEQAILEARFLYHVDHREEAAIAALLPEFLARKDSFKLEESAIFGEREDWLAVIEYVQAIAALGKGDKVAFKKHITEAFWLSPGQAAAFAPHIDRLRLDDFMQNVRVDFNTSLASLDSGEKVTLEKVIGGKKALILHFWSPRAPECEAAMPDFISTAASLQDKHIAVASLLPGDVDGLAKEARAMIKPFAGKSTGAWLIDSETQQLGRLMRVRNVPAMVIIGRDGGVLFNGRPEDVRFWESLQKIDDRVQRPASLIDDGE